MILRTYPYCGTLVVVTLLVYTVKMVQQLTRLLVWRFDLRQSNQYSRSPVNNNINVKKIASLFHGPPSKTTNFPR